MRLILPILSALVITIVANAQDIPHAKMISESSSAGALSAAPSTGVSGEYGTWTITYTVGADGIESGGGIRVQLPDAWHAGPRNSANRLQATIPEDDHYVSASCTRDNVVVRAIVENQRDRTLIKHQKVSLDGRNERYVFVVRVVVVNGKLEQGDEIRIVYGDTTKGSRGYRAGEVTTGPVPILAAIDTEGNGQFRLHTDRPNMTLLPGRPARLRLHAPSTGAVGEAARLLVSMVDKEGNPVNESDEINLKLIEGSANSPSTLGMEPDKGYAETPITPTGEGIVRFEATSDKWVLSARSNPMRVTNETPDVQIFWGDLHSHTRFSWDGVGYDNFDYARYISGLDFYAMTDHARVTRKGYTRGLNPKVWDEYTRLTEKHHAPPEFVTLHAYECSFGSPYGHHNVFFRGKPGPLVAPADHTLPELWKMLTSGDALTIPHHTGKFPRDVDFSIHNPEFRRNFEIYSGHGLSETYNPLHPLAFEHSKFTSPSSSLDRPSHAQDAWRMGLHVSTIAASDDHRSRPGLPHFGITAVFAPEQTRDAIFQALYDRRTYGTTGVKILLDFQVNGTPMGQFATAKDSPEVYINAVGTDTISRVELLRIQAGEDRFQIVKTWNPDALEFETTFEDDAYQARAIYYVRLRQAQPVNGRLAMAWSSPVWVQ